jgi:4'-phosphopantetheinyl transferase
VRKVVDQLINSAIGKIDIGTNCEVSISIVWLETANDLLVANGITLPPEEVHVWAWGFQYSAEILRQKALFLSAEERFCAVSFRFEEDRVRYATSHAHMRIILGHYLNLNPTEIHFDRNRFGKPRLALSHGIPKLNFSLAHTHSSAILAICARHSVGADIEEIRPIEREVAELYFSARERAELRRLTGDEWLRGFFNCWTRKEAVLKAEGLGLNVKLDSFDVSLLPGEPAAILDIRAGDGVISDWHLLDLNPGPNLAGALATPVIPSRLACFHFVE